MIGPTSTRISKTNLRSGYFILHSQIGSFQGQVSTPDFPYRFYDESQLGPLVDFRQQVAFHR
jgi:hypothetical protein